MEDKKFKASHFENIYELIKTCKMWITDDDYDAYCRFFDMGAMEELLNLIEKQEKLIQGLNKQADELVDDYEKQLQEKNEYIFRLESERNFKYE